MSSDDCFNSRVRGGRDAFDAVPAIEQAVSTHASAGDATGCVMAYYATYMPFQLTRPRGTRHNVIKHIVKKK